MKTLICLIAVTVISAAYSPAQTGRVTKGDGALPASGTARLYVTPVPVADKSLAGLIKAADIVIDGTVESVLPARLPSASNLETDVRIVIGSVIKGALAAKNIMVSQAGGTVGAVKIVPQQYDLMQPGERYILFLTQDGRPSTPKLQDAPAYYVLGAWLGLVQVSNNKIHVTRSPGLVQYDGSDVSVFETAATDVAKSLGTDH